MHHPLTIRPGNTYTQESLEEDTILKSVSFTPCIQTGCGRTVVLIQINEEKEVSICALTVGVCESIVLNLPLRKGTKVSMFVEGKNEVDVLFYEFEEDEREYVETAPGKYIGLTISEKRREVLRETAAIRVLSASLRMPQADMQVTRTVLFYQSQEGDIPLVSFLPGRKETEVINLEFPAHEEVCFGVRGPGLVDLLVLRDEEELEPSDITSCSVSEGNSSVSDSCSEQENMKTDTSSSTGKRKITETESPGEIPTKRISTTDSKSGATHSKHGVSEHSESTAQGFSLDAPKEDPKQPLETKQQKQEAENVPVSARLHEAHAESGIQKEQSINLHIEEALCLDSSQNNDSAVLQQKQGVSVISEGIGKLIGKKTTFLAEYQLTDDDGETISQEQVVCTRTLPQHPILKCFSQAVLGTREGTVLSSSVKQKSREYECLFTIKSIQPQNKSA